MDITNYFLLPKQQDSYTNLPEFAFSHPQEYKVKPVQYGAAIDCPDPQNSAWNSFLHPWHELENNLFSYLNKFFNPATQSVATQNYIDAPSHAGESLRRFEANPVTSVVLQLTVHTEIPNRNIGVENKHSESALMMYGY